MQQSVSSEESNARVAKVLFYNIAKGSNTGSIVRSCCAMGVSECVVVGKTSTKEARMKFGAQGTHNRIRSTFHETLGDAVATLKGDGFHIVGVEITEGARPLDSNPFPGNKVCFLFGNEGDGLTPAATAVCDSFVYIRQYGQKTASLNVSVAAGIVLYQWAQWAQLKEAVRVGNKYYVSEKQPVLIGTYSTHQGHVKGQGKGVYRCFVSPHTGLLTDLELVVEKDDSSYLALYESHDNASQFVLINVVESGTSTTDRVESMLLDKATLQPVESDKSFRMSTGCAPCHLECKLFVCVGLSHSS